MGLCFGLRAAVSYQTTYCCIHHGESRSQRHQIEEERFLRLLVEYLTLSYYSFPLLPLNLS